MLLHNWLFPDTELSFKGFVEHDNALLPVVTQLDIPASRGATQQETDEYMKQLGFNPIRIQNPTRQDDYLNEIIGVEINDLHDENVLVRPDGSLAIMDPVPMMDEISKLQRVSFL